MTFKRFLLAVAIAVAIAVGSIALLVIGVVVVGSRGPSHGTVADSAPRAGVTLTNYLSLREGMTYEDAVRILGKPGVEQSRTDFAGISTVMYGWEGKGFGANMNAMFQNGKLISKAQFGLR